MQDINRNNNYSILKNCIIWTFFWGLLAHGFAFLNLHYVHDSLVLSQNFRGDGTFCISLGRFFQPIYVLFRGKISGTWLVGVLSLFYVSIVNYMLCNLFRIDNNKNIILTSGFVSVSNTLIVIYSTYIYAADTFMLSNLLSVFSAWNIIKTRNKIIGTISSAFLLAISLAIYQAYISVFILVVYLYVLSLLLDREPTNIKTVFKLLFNVFFVVIFGMALYYIGVKISLRIINEQLSSYLNWEAVTDIKAKGILFIKTYKDFVKTYMTFALHNTCITIIHIVLFLYVSIILGKYIFLNIKNKVYSKTFYLIILLLFLPFVTNIIYFFTLKKYELTKLSFSLIYLIIVFCFAIDTTKIKKIIYVLLLIVFVNNIIIANQVYTKRQLVYDSTKQTVTRMLAMMSSEEDYIEGKTPVVFVGNFNSNPLFHNYSDFDNVNILTSQNQDSAITYYSTFMSFIRYIINTNPNFLAWGAEEDAIKKHQKDIDEMKIFPQKGSCKMIDNIMFIRVSK